ncbi:cupin domain-containing protein [Staphylococcus gallinarum]|uniref:Cupin domain-containing protein n=1 Tax=Staphylococcus gallinarum TaxID=1293 RepID=A0A418HN24_STAGA|nr:cupin domain-containing protein [Staphylococcus gallinarum]RIL42645.1 cupin domain-containing protein [Staphylococcus gallinarum]RIO89305.1 cupin domain-containing protein [Staphylococcus gallinarum]
METKIVKPEDADVFLEGSEVCREYIKTDLITFGTSELHPGVTGAVDEGHKNSQEVFYVVKGTVLLRCGEKLYELNEGDAQIIPEDTPHQLTNIGECIAKVSWSLAPSE